MMFPLFQSCLSFYGRGRIGDFCIADIYKHNRPNMITSYERSDLIHIMKMNRFTLSDSNTVQLEFGGQVKGKSYKIKILVVEDLPRISIQQNGEAIFNDTAKSADDFVDIS